MHKPPGLECRASQGPTGLRSIARQIRQNTIRPAWRSGADRKACCQMTEAATLQGVCSCFLLSWSRSYEVSEQMLLREIVRRGLQTNVNVELEGRILPKSFLCATLASGTPQLCQRLALRHVVRSSVQMGCRFGCKVLWMMLDGKSLNKAGPIM